jgi:hypothetical protein
VIGLTFEGANPDPVVTGDGRLAGVSNYLRGSDPNGWLTGVPSYSRVTYRELSDGVDLDWYANRAGELDKPGNFYIDGFTDSTDFPVTPGAFQTENAGAFDVFLVKVDLGKRHKGSGQQTASVTTQERASAGPRAGPTRDRVGRLR